MIPVIIITIFMALILFFESIYVSVIYNPFRRMIQKIQQKPFEIRWTGAIVAYMALFTLMYFFIIEPKRPVKYAFLLGILMYTIYGGINYATFKDWDWSISLAVALWGATLFSISAYVRRHIFTKTE